MESEDCNTFVADIATISCCCPCLILQIVVFIFLKLPRKIAQKARDYAEKLRHRRKGEVVANGDKNCCEYRDENEYISLRIEIEARSCEGEGRCMDEVEKVLGELSMKGEFAFGSFWGRDATRRPPSFILL